MINRYANVAVGRDNSSLINRIFSTIHSLDLESPTAIVKYRV